MSLHQEIAELSKQLDVIELCKAFDPMEARDSHGRWSSVRGISLKLIYDHGEMREYSILDDKNKHIGGVVVDTTDPKHPFIEDIGLGEDMDDYSEHVQPNANKLGLKTIKEIARQLKLHLPEAETFSGLRASGARHGRAARSPKIESDYNIVSIRTKLIKQLEDDLAKVEKSHQR